MLIVWDVVCARTHTHTHTHTVRMVMSKTIHHSISILKHRENEVKHVEGLKAYIHTYRGACSIWSPMGPHVQ